MPGRFSHAFGEKRFRELADSHAARPGFYGLAADDLPEIVELGFSIQKVGESAAVPLDTFSIEGRKRGNLRRAWRKAAPVSDATIRPRMVAASDEPRSLTAGEGPGA